MILYRYFLMLILLGLVPECLTSHELLAQDRMGSEQAIQPIEIPQISGGARMDMLRRTGGKMGVEKPAPFLPYAPSQVTNGPELGESFDAVDFDADGAYSDYYHIPPDPIGAAGPSHLVCIVNTSIEWYTKAGVLLGGKRLGMNSTTAVGSFFESLSPLTGTFDPKVIYDQYEGRFLVVALEHTDVDYGDPANTSRIFLAVSATSDPTGTWYFAQRDSKLNYLSADRWADYPGLAVDDKAVYVSANMFGFGTSGGYATSSLWVFNKGVTGGFYTGGVATSAVYINPHTAAGVSATTMQPAHMFGTVPGGMGTFLVRYSGFHVGINEYLSIIRVDNPLGSASFTNTDVACGNIDDTSVPVPEAPQMGSAALVSTNDRRSLNAVWRDDQLYISTTLVPPSGLDAGQATAHWFNVNTTSLSSLVLDDQGDVGGEDIATGTYTFFPSVAVDPLGNLGIGFSASGPAIYPGAYFSGRFSSDAPGTTRGSGVLRAGLDSYVRTFGGGSNRWGDYSGSCTDPSDGSFWFFNQYAITAGTAFGGEDGRWGTAFGNLYPSALPIELASLSGSIEESRYVVLNWETASEIDNFGFEIQKSRALLAGYATILGSFISGYGTTNVPQHYSFRDPTSTEGSWYYRLKQIDLDGSFHYSHAFRIEVPSRILASQVPPEVSLAQNFPNPFNPTTVIRYSLPEDTEVELVVCNILGEIVAELVRETQAAGNHEAIFGDPDLPSGVYFCRLQAGGEVLTRKLLRLR